MGRVSCHFLKNRILGLSNLVGLSLKWEKWFGTGEVLSSPTSVSPLSLFKKNKT